MNISAVTIVLFINVIAVITTNQIQSTQNYRRITRIANGKQLDNNYFPYVVGLKTERSDGQINFCTGTLLSSLFVLTAAHCIVDTNAEEVALINVTIL